MRNTIIAFAVFGTLFSMRPAAAADQGLSPQVTAQLCGEKKAGLAKLEAEAPQVRALLAEKEPKLKDARTEMDKWDKLSLAVVAGAIPDWLQTTAKLAGLDPVGYVNREHGRAANKVGPLRDEVAGLKQRQTEVGSQIFLLRDIIEGLGCDALTPAKPQPPPVDYGAIEQLNQQFQQSAPGGTPGAGGGVSGQSVQPQSPSYTAPTSGFGTTVPTGQSPPPSGGPYGYPPSYGTPSPQVPWEGLAPPSSAGGGGKPASNPCGGG